MKDALQNKQRNILSTADCFRRESPKKRIEIAGVNVEGQAIHLCDNAGKWWCKRWLRLRASSYLNGSSDQEEASNTRPFNYRSWSMHVKHGDAMLDLGDEMVCKWLPLYWHASTSREVTWWPVSFFFWKKRPASFATLFSLNTHMYTCFVFFFRGVHLFCLCTFILSPTFFWPGSMNRSWTVRTIS